MITWKQSESRDFDKIKAFYWSVIDGLEGKPSNPDWKKDVFPDDAILHSVTDKRELYYAEENGEVIAAFVLNHECSDGYDKAPWEIKAAPEEVSIIHLLGISPKRFGTGLGNKTIEQAEKVARENGQKAIRFDVLPNNVSAQRLYERHGFKKISDQKIYYEDTGWAEFYLYEKVL